MGENGFCAGKNAQDLLKEFQQTGQEAPFAEIARRYAGMVYNVALKVTRDAHDAEDATQATFLTLAVHAKTDGKISYLGPWLKKVSHRLALDIRRSKKRRVAREQRHATANGAASNGNGHDLPVSGNLHIEELRAVLREEIDKLPAKYRMPLILYYFGGLTPEQIGDQLHCNTSTLGVRLHRGRKMLAESLSERGVALSALLVGAVLGGLVDSFVKDNIVYAAANAASSAQVGGRMAAHAAMPGSNVLSLMRVAKAALKWVHMKGAVAVVLVALTTLVSGGEILRRFDLLNISVLQNLNPIRMIQPLLNRIFSAPHLSVQSSPAMPSANVAIGLPDPMPFAGSEGWGSSPLAMNFPASTHEPSVQPMTITSSAATGPSSLLSQPSPQPTVALSVQNGAINAPPASAAKHSSTQPPQLNAAPQVASSSSPRSSPAFAAPPAGQTWIVDRKTGNISIAGATASSLTLPNGTTRVPSFMVGDQTSGSVLQDAGTLQASQQVVIANQPASTGTYTISGTGQLNTPNLTVARAGDGTLVQNGGTVNVTTSNHDGQVTIGQLPQSNGTYTMTGGNLTADNVVVGQQGQGTLNASGGTASVTTVTVGADQGGTGAVSLTKLAVIETSLPLDPAVAISMTDQSQSPAAPPVPTIVVGQSGTGSFVLKPVDSSVAPIQETPGTPGSSLVIRSDFTGNGTFSGAGVVQLTGPIVQNGVVIGNGFGTHQALDFSSASRVSNTIENPPNSGRNGWYAENLGSVILPRISLNGSEPYTWGEDNLDDMIDLVNSIRFTPHSNSDPTLSTGDVGITLLDPNDPSIPSLPDALKAIGMWSFDTTADLSSIDLIVRYDDQLANSLNMSQSDLELLAYDDGQWVTADPATLAVNLSNDLINGTIDDGSFTYLAVAGVPDGLQPATTKLALLSPVNTPEPTTALLAALGAAELLCRRSRRR